MVPVLSVATVNVLNDRSRRPERRRLLADDLAALSPDLIALQEVTFPLGYSTAHWLADELGGYSAHVCPKAGLGRTLEGVALLSRLLVERHETIDLGSQQRRAQLIRVRCGQRAVNVTNTHLYWPTGAHAARVRQVERLLDWLGTSEPDSANIICGDFNATPGSPAIALMRRSFVSTHEARHGREPEYTYPTPLVVGGRFRSAITRGLLRLFTNRPGATWRGAIDYIFVSPYVRVVDCRVILDRPSRDDPTLYASDHLGLMATLELPPASGGDSKGRPAGEGR
jgi:endonuclease/exonuclease/phosphatase family metal-dependent hydrolase